MNGRTQLALAHAPDWMTAEMPPGYRTRVLEIERLTKDLHGMDRVGSVLWESGEALKDAVGAVFAALKCSMDVPPGPSAALTVGLGETRRLLVLVSGASSVIEKTNEGLAQAFQAVQFAQPADRVVFIVNNDPAVPPAGRPDPVLPDALGILQRMGVNVLTTGTLFGLWRLSLDDQPKAWKALERLHAQDGGPFVVPVR